MMHQRRQQQQQQQLMHNQFVSIFKKMKDYYGYCSCSNSTASRHGISRCPSAPPLYYERSEQWGILLNLAFNILY
ncbi:hypothetical protein AgCh_039661 [Apium graveolens]